MLYFGPEALKYVINYLLTYLLTVTSMTERSICANMKSIGLDDRKTVSSDAQFIYDHLKKKIYAIMKRARRCCE